MSFTPQEMEALFTRGFQALQSAGWIHRHLFRVGKGHHVVWSAEGVEKISALRAIATHCRLDVNDGNALTFDKLAHGERLAADTGVVGDIPDLFFEFWRQEIDPLGFRGDADGLLVLVHIAKQWAPTPGTPEVSDN